MTPDLEGAVRILARNGNVLAAWVFGSARDGEIRAGSDLDLGVLFFRAPGLDELAELRSDLQRALGVEEIDLVPLNGAGPVLRFEAVSGRSLFSEDGLPDSDSSPGPG